MRRLLVPRANAGEAAVVQELEVLGLSSLSEAVGLLTGAVELDPVAFRPEDHEPHRDRYAVDFGDVRGQEFAKRAMVIAAAGDHPESANNLLTAWHMRVPAAYNTDALCGSQ